MSVHALTGFIAANPHLAYGAAFLLALSEAIPAVGAVVPGSALLIGIAALVPQGLISVWPLLATALLGAIVGDGLSYWLGHRYGKTLLNRWPLNRHKDLIARSEAFLQRHGGKSVFLARFTPGVRAFVPLLAGSLGMSPVRFYLANVLSALAWAPAHVLPGVAVGASVSAVGGHAGRLGVLLAILAVVLWLVIWITRTALRRGIPLVLSLRDRLWRWATARDTWLSRPIRALLDPSRPETGALALLLAWYSGRPGCSSVSSRTHRQRRSARADGSGRLQPAPGPAITPDRCDHDRHHRTRRHLRGHARDPHHPRMAPGPAWRAAFY